MTPRRSPGKVRGLMGRYFCLCCGRGFTARQADRERGWAKTCSKSCAARLRERKGLPMPRHVPELDGARLALGGPEFQFEDDADADL